MSSRWGGRQDEGASSRFWVGVVEGPGLRGQPLWPLEENHRTRCGHSSPSLAANGVCGQGSNGIPSHT